MHVLTNPQILACITTTTTTTIIIIISPLFSAGIQFLNPQPWAKSKNPIGKLREESRCNSEGFYLSMCRCCRPGPTRPTCFKRRCEKKWEKREGAVDTGEYTQKFMIKNIFSSIVQEWKQCIFCQHTWAWKWRRQRSALRIVIWCWAKGALSIISIEGTSNIRNE